MTRLSLFGSVLLGGSVETIGRAATPFPVPLTVALASGSAYGPVTDGITTRTLIQVVGQTAPNTKVGLDKANNGGGSTVTQADGSGRFTLNVAVLPGANLLKFGPVLAGKIYEQASLVIVCWPLPAPRPFNGSPTPAASPAGRLIANSQAYAPGLPPRPPAKVLSQAMVEDPNNPAFSPNIVLGLVFFGQFVDHDVTLNDTAAGQGPSIFTNAGLPIDLRTPALDLDSMYGLGPSGDSDFYTPDGLFFRFNNSAGTDLLRDNNGVAIIGDPRNDENGQIESIHLAFQHYHNTLVTAALGGVAPGLLNPAQKAAVFGMARNQVIGFHQGLVANELAVAFTGQPVADGMPPLTAIPVEFSAAVYRLGHSLVPNTIVVNAKGTRMNPTDPSLRGPGTEVPYQCLFGPFAQPAARFDALLSVTMHTLLIPLSPRMTLPTDPDLIGGNAPNIGQGNVIGGIMHLDLAETNILRGREQFLPSGEEYLAYLEGRPYHPLIDGNTDLFVYILREATPLGHLGRVGSDIFHRTIGGIIAADPWRYTNPSVYTPEQIMMFKQANFAMLLHLTGGPGF